MTFVHALQIRRHAAGLDLDHLVLETDAPDIPSAWLLEPDRCNSPGQLPRIAAELAALRHCSPEEVGWRTTATAQRVLPRLPTFP